MKLARALLKSAIATFKTVPPEQRGPSLAAIDSFLADPTPSRFVAASGVLARERRGASLRGVDATFARRAFERGLEALAAAPGIEPALVDSLRGLEVDRKSGARLEAIAALITAHHELAGRVAAEREALRRRLGYDAPAATTPPGRPTRRSGR